MDVYCYLIVGLICILLNTSEVKHLFMSLLVIYKPLVLRIHIAIPFKIKSFILLLRVLYPICKFVVVLKIFC